jgi:hypothetical protein
MRGAPTTSRLPLWQPAAIALSIALAYGLSSSAPAQTVGLVAVVLGAVLTLWLPPHLFVAGSLAALVAFQLSAEHPIVVGGVALYSSDLLVALVTVRALAPRPRRIVDWSIFDAATGGAVLVWALVMTVAAARGYGAGTPMESLVRLDEQVFYYLLLPWAFVRVLRERSVSATKVAKALATTALAFVGYMAFERITHHRFEDPSTLDSSHLGSVVTAQGVTLHRDYGFYSAYDLYGLAALAAIAYLLFARRSSGAPVAAAGTFVLATCLTLVRGIVFGLIVGVALLAFASRSAVRDRLARNRLLPLAALLGIAIGLFWTVSPTSAQGMAERFLPGVAAQSSSAVQTARARQQALSFGYHEANVHPFGRGLVLPGSSRQGLAEAGLSLSAWATMLVYTGWLGLLAFLWPTLLLIRRSSQLSDGPGWLKPFFVAAFALLLVAAFGSAGIVGQPWVLGEAALVIGLRFGLADLDD